MAAWVVVLLVFACWCGADGAATAIITTAPASISEPAIPVRPAAFARSPLTMAVMILLPYRCPGPCDIRLGIGPGIIDGVAPRMPYGG